MGFAQRRIRQIFEEQEKRVVQSFSARGAYTMDKGIGESQISGHDTTLGKGVIDSLVNKGILRKLNGVCWMDFTAYGEYMEHKKRTNIIIACVVVGITAVMMIVVYFFR